ncbi:MAG: histidine phosphatase family protein [Candidatus Thiodiazotropha sp. (ex Troendleina suluensis)]|nr:histidine phosphatase family protein [Candidatus Thiodiazotropha sp. (ex Troendleina suluensis)]MCU7945531.1 histidine phosphatase family protein [Candidatus Thiodiazotropha sp. (ex Cardiolucina cf. quadrata)]
MPITTIDLLRHGEPVGGRRYRGQIDDPLSERGWEEMWHAVSGKRPWQAIISSPLQRCSQFAQALSNKLDISLEFDDRLKEVGFGIWEGQSGEQLRAQDRSILSRFYNDPVNHRPDNAESLEVFNHRVNMAYQQAAEQHSGKHLLIVAHAGVIRSMLIHALQAPIQSMYRISIASASLSRIQIDAERPPTVVFTGKSQL